MTPQSDDGVRGYRVLDREVYPSLGRVVRDGDEVHLEPRVMDLLVFFLKSPGDVLSREAIVDAVWREQFVGEGVIRQSVAAIRRALGDDAREPRFIETIPKRGYRLIAEGGRAVLEDLGSKNGTILRGERIEEPTGLTDGDAIEIGRVVLIFRSLYTARTATDRGLRDGREA